MKKRFCILFLIFILLFSTSFQMVYSKTKKDISVNNSNKNYNIIFVCSLPENEYWISCMEGMKQADNELGSKTKIIGPKDIDHFSTEIVDYMKQAIEEKPDGIIAYSGIEALEPLIEQATEKGIPVLSIDSDAPTTSRIAYVGTDSYNAGHEAAKKMIELVGENAQIGVFVSSKSAEKEMEVVKAFSEMLYDYNIEIVTIEETFTDIPLAENKIQEALKKYPNIKGLFNTSNNVTAAAHVKEALNLKNLALVGFDDTKENVELIKKGLIDAVLVQSIKQAGYKSVYLMNEYLNKGSLSQKKYDSGITLVTKENIDTYTNTESRTNLISKDVKIGYYSGTPEFQNGFDGTTRKTGYAYEYYQIIADIVGWDYIYTYGTRTEMLDLLEKGKVDIVAGVYKTKETQKKFLFPDYDMGLIGLEQYFAVNSKRQDLIDDLNYALKELAHSNPSYTTTLLQKYYSPAKNIVLTTEEKDLLSKKDTLKMGYMRNCLPLSEENSNGKPSGLVADLIVSLTQYIQIEIEPIAFNTISEMEESLKKGEIDTAFPIYSDQWANEVKGFRQTDSFIHERVMLVYKGEFSSDLLNKVALSRTGIGQAYYMNTYYPNSEISFYDSRKETLDAIELGKENCMIGCSSILQRFLKNNAKYNNLNIAYLETTESFGMAVKQDYPILVSILNKAIRQINTARITNSILKNSTIDNVTFKEFIQQYSLFFILFLTIFIAFIIIIFVLYLRNTNKYKKEQLRTHKALEKALKDANSANEAKTNFLSSISHDIRTPMNAIIGMTSIAYNHLDNKQKTADCLEKISLSSQHLLTLVNNVLDISKIESGKLQLVSTEFSLKETITTMLDILQSTIEQKNIKFETNIDSLKYDVFYADKTRINQVFMNILTNAIKYTPDNGSVKMNIFEELSNDKKNVHLTYVVEDTGIGMSKDFMEHMYNTFSRAEDSRINEIQGTGLGLAIVKQMVDLMQGSIDCQSTIGKGTKFTITLDLPLGDIENNNIHPNMNVSETQAANLQKLHLLIAEDNELNWEIISELLNLSNIKAVRAKNGQECIEILNASAPGTYDLILMDIQMPILNGREATKIIRNDERDYIKNIPIIAMTADAFAEDIEACLNVGMNGHVAKPIDMNKLYQEIKKVINA